MESKITCICVDDELPALKLIETYCVKNPNLELLKAFNDSEKALQFLKENKVDLVILDIQMPKINGIEFYKLIKEKSIGIFISANPNFAIDAFEINIIDFILKPASFERFEKAINKVLDFVKIRNNEKFITIKQDYLSENISLKMIDYIEGSGEYLKIVTSKKSYLIFQRMKDFEQEHGKLGFVRIHKSYLTLKENIQSSNFSSVTLQSGKILPLGRVYKSILKELK